MRNVVLSIVVVAALVTAGIGGTFATWSDSEVSEDNFVATGSLDLKVNGADDEPWGTGVPVKVAVECVIPQKFYGPYEIELWNAGQCDFPSHAYIHLKDYVCSNICPKVNPYPDGGSPYWPPGETTGYPAPDGSGLKPEPELVAEYGGKVNCVTVPGIGPEGDECSMGSHVELIVTGTPLPPNDDNAEVLIRDLLGKWYCKELYLFDLMPCEPRTIYIWVYLRQDSEEDYGYNYFLTPEELDIDPATHPDEYAAALLHWKKFNDWPSAALMKDKVVFDLEFDLWLEDTPGAVVPPPEVLPDEPPDCEIPQ